MYLALKYSYIKGNIIILQLLIKFVYVIMTLMLKNNSRNGRHYNSENLSVSFVSPKIYFLDLLLYMKNNSKHSLFRIVEYL